MKKALSWTNIKPVVVLLVICLASALLMSVVNMLTATKIADNQNAEAAAAMKVVLPEGTTFTELELTEDYPSAVENAYKSDAGYVFRVSVAGNKPGLVVMCGISNDGRVVGVEVLSDDETPGYKDKIFPLVTGTEGKYSGQSADTLTPEVVTGATKSSNGMYNAVKASLDAYTVALGGSADDTPEDETPAFDNGGVSTRSESEIIAIAEALMPGSYELTEREGLPTSVTLYRETSGNGYAIQITTKTQWRPIEIDAVVTVNAMGTITGVRVMDWIVGYDSELLDEAPACDEAFTESIVGKNADGLIRVDLVTHATNSSNNLIDPLRDTLYLLYPTPVYSIIGWVILALAAIATVGAVVFINVKRRKRA